tara:strand:- start:48 stop:716 length:669 start_codon:yes stop_codon:yes gene_type:complete
MFDVDLLQGISDWQLGGDVTAKQIRGERLKVLAADLPAEFKSCATNCYRRLSLTKGSVWKVGTEYALDETISSWTLSLDVAQAFKDGVPSKGYQGSIFVHQPSDQEVIVNLNALFSDAEFQLAVSQRRAEIKNFERGIGRYGNSQCEVVLSLEKLPLDSVHCWGGYIGDEKSFEGMLPDGETMEGFKKLLASSSFDFNQPHWLCDLHAIKRVNNVLANSGKK